jgi:hypothetical protein
VLSVAKDDEISIREGELEGGGIDARSLDPCDECREPPRTAQSRSSIRRHWPAHARATERTSASWGSSAARERILYARSTPYSYPP